MGADRVDKGVIRCYRPAERITAPPRSAVNSDVLQLILSLPVIGYSAWIFFDGLVRALRQRTLDMIVLVAVAIGAGWLYLLVVTLRGDGDVFYQAATVLATFVLLGHWFEMRACGGANDAVRTLLDLAPPKAVVLGDGEMVTGESMPMSSSAGSELIGATINLSGTLRTRAAKVGADTALGRSRSWSRRRRTRRRRAPMKQTQTRAPQCLWCPARMTVVPREVSTLRT